MLAIRELSKTYANGVHALDDVTLDIPRGMFGLLGPNGAGKSSLMRTLATLQEADSGSATLDGADGGTIDVLRDKDAVRRQLGYLPQDFGVYPKVSAEDLLDHFAVLKGLTARKQRREVVDGAAAAGQPVGCAQAQARHVSPAACASASASRRRCSAIRAWSSSTSPPPASIPRSATASSTCWPRSARTWP